MGLPNTAWKRLWWNVTMDLVKEILNATSSMTFVVLNVSPNEIFTKYEIHIINVLILLTIFFKFLMSFFQGPNGIKCRKMSIGNFCVIHPQYGYYAGWKVVALNGVHNGCLITSDVQEKSPLCLQGAGCRVRQRSNVTCVPKSERTCENLLLLCVYKSTTWL